MGYKLDMLKMIFKRSSSDFRKLIKKEKIDNKSIKYAQVNNETPTVVFVNGYGVGLRYWDEVFLEIAKTNTVFAYNRDDGKILNENIMPSKIVEDMRQLLLKRGLKAPYVLVGHSLGGLFVQYYAKKYPDEIAGVILVDSSGFKDFKDKSLIAKKLQKRYEKIVAYTDNCAKEIEPLDMFSNIPMISLFATQEVFIKHNPEWIAWIEARKEEAKEYYKTYPSCKLQWVDSGHMMMYEKPEVVSTAIKEVLSTPQTQAPN